jgi:SP family xylose:H+ symportor-like MFS transporter
MYYAPEIFKAVSNSSTDIALLQTIAIGAVSLVFTIIAIWTVDKVGRKPLLIIGSCGMGISLTALGFGAYFNVIGGWLLIFVLGYIACFAVSLGPVVWVVLSEIFPTRVRGRALGLATFCLWTANYVISQTFPMMDKNAWLLEKFNHAFPFWLYAGFCAILMVFVIFWVPETKGKRLEEIEMVWLSSKSETPQANSSPLTEVSK